MAKPVVGYLGYDSADDRPTVKLAAGLKKLLTEDDSSGGGGGPHASSHENLGSDEIDVTGLSGVLADPQDPAAHASRHQNAGTDEISVAGLSGVLADAQRANVIVSSSDLSVGTITDGEFLKRSGSTVISATPTSAQGAPSEFWAIPSSPNANDVEFDSSTLPSSFSLFDTNGATATAVTPLSGIDAFTVPAAANCRIEANKAAKRSWLLLQPRNETRRWFYAKKITLSGTNGWVFRTRLATATAWNSGSNNAATMRLALYKDDGSGTKPADAAGGGAADGFAIGWESDGASMSLQFDSLKTSTPTTHITLADRDDAGANMDCELCALLLSGASSFNWQYWVRSPTYSWQVGSATSVTMGAKQGDTVWIGFEFFGIDLNPLGGGIILSADYLRFEDTVANFLP